MKPELIVAIISALISLVATYLSWQNAKDNSKLQQRMDEKELSIENKRFFASILWGEISKLSYINSEKPVWPDVIRAVNTMEITAECWARGIADKDMVYTCFGSLFNELYDQIYGISEMYPDLKRNGRELLGRNVLIEKMKKDIFDIKVNLSQSPSKGIM